MSMGSLTRAPVIRTASTAVKPCQGDSLEFYLITGNPDGQPATDNSSEVQERTILETFSNITPENKAYYDAEKEAIHLLLTRIGDEIYSNFDACKTAHDMWIAIERAKNRETQETGKRLHLSKEKMLLCKQAKKGVPLQAEQADWLGSRDHDIEPLDKADQNAEECDDKRVVLANLIANLKLDTDKNKKIQKQLKKPNTSLSHELQECKSALEECKSSLEKSNRIEMNIV
ncbi:hypothetical protein Tco_1227335 [Tanacetum coccineum]